ncbi:hypothetical protein [Hymenobacter edaphi]|uniref:hypothetical protein n=1 Tax=Hymenobacter edaphi TaxID=2211146 RepID=UPI001057C23A|nr:hypothetical protein [Hymenobacter edaphi]
MDPDWPLFVVPHQSQKNCCQLARIVPDGQLHRLRPRLPFPFTRLRKRNPHALNAGWLVGLLPFDPQQPVMRLFRARLHAGGQRLERLPDIKLHPALEVHSLLLDGDWLYLGGGTNRWAHHNLSAKDVPVGEYFSRLRLSDANPALTTLPLPVEFGPGKAVDDLQRDAYGQLLVLDNVVCPKYLFLYQLYGHQPPKWLKTHKLPFHRVNETYERASWNEHFIALLSWGVGEVGSTRYISVLRRRDMKPVWLAGEHWRHRFQLAEIQTPRPHLSDAVICENQVVFALGLGGLGSARLDAATVWPKRRVSYGYYECWPNGRNQPSVWRRERPYEFASEIDLRTAGPAEGVTWLPPTPEQPAIVETVRAVHPTLLLLTGRHEPRGLEVCWTRLI